MACIISDTTKPGQNAYRCDMRDGNVKGVALVRETVIRRGAYELSTYAVNVTGAALGTRQQVTAALLKREAKTNLVRSLIAAGWRSERLPYGTGEITLWWPAVASWGKAE